MICQATKRSLFPLGEEGLQTAPIAQDADALPKVDLTTKLQVAKAQARDGLQKIQLYIGANAVPLQEHQTPETISSQLAQLQSDDMSPSDFLVKSCDALSAYQELQLQFRSNDQATNYQDQRMLGQLDDEINLLEAEGWVSRLFARGRKKSLTTQRDKIQQQIEQKEAENITRRQQMALLQNQQEQILEKRDKLLSVEAGQEARAIKEVYERFVQDIFQDGTMTAEIRDAYIQQVITPEVDKIIKEHGLSADTREAFDSAMRRDIDHRDEPADQQKLHRQVIDTLFLHNAALEDQYDLLISGTEKNIIEQLVAKMAAEDIALIKTIVEPTLSWDTRYKLPYILEQAINSAGSPTVQSFGKRLLEELNESDE